MISKTDFHKNEKIKFETTKLSPVDKNFIAELFSDKKVSIIYVKDYLDNGKFSIDDEK
jgi:hypothetical protein